MLYLAIALVVSVCIICGTSVGMMISNWKRLDKKQAELTKAASDLVDILMDVFEEQKKEGAEALKEESVVTSFEDFIKETEKQIETE